MTPEWLPHPDRVWRLTAPSGDVLKLWWDDAIGQYRGNDVPVGPNWPDAKAKCEAAVKPKGTRR